MTETIDLEDFPLLGIQLSQKGLQARAGYTTTEAAKLLDLSVRMIETHAENLVIRSWRPNGQTSFMPIDLECYLRMTNGPESQSPSDVYDWLICSFGSCSRLDAFLQEDLEMDDEDWLSVLGEIWTGIDNTGENGYELMDGIASRVEDHKGPIPALMTTEERIAFDGLPETITIYRGCGPVNLRGFSWSLNRQIAANFPRNSRFRTDNPVLLTATIKKSRAAALKLGRNEQEVIVLSFEDEPHIDWTMEELSFDTLEEAGSKCDGQDSQCSPAREGNN